MIAAVAERRAAGDWRGACAAADVDVCLRPDSIRRDYGAEIADQASRVLRDLAPDLLRWHLPRRGHGCGDLLAGLLVPLAEFTDGSRRLTLAAATAQSALDAGQRIVLVVLGGGDDGATRSVLEAVRLKYPERLSLLRHPMFWNAEAAPELAGLCDLTPAERQISRWQDAGLAAEAWQAAGIELQLPASAARTRWLAALPIRLPGLVDRVRAALPGVDEAVVRSGVGALVLSGLNAATAGARVAADRAALDLPIVPNAVWSRVLDADLLRLGHLGEHELHPLVASARLDHPQPAVPESDEWLYREVPFIAGPGHSAGDILVLWIHCGTTRHRIAYHRNAWHILDHSAHPGRESLLARLGGPTNPCQQALDYLSSGRHVIDLIESLLHHGRATDIRDLLRTHAGASTTLSHIDLPTGGTVGAALAALRENTLRHRMILAGATRTPSPSTETNDHRRRARKGVPARTHW
ncbi:hypothetical protein [Catenulispora pinisilvae]|uniref:hypothetical protein n=1 Tax=Catenulispora pinisilvae TaxID=2705253 RepID=UPI001891F36C|nr:hypothetical protein [Catenulispora pinisilvae]